MSHRYPPPSFMRSPDDGAVSSSSSDGSSNEASHPVGRNALNKEGQLTLKSNKEGQLTDLLAKAAESIRTERKKSHTLQQEVDNLRMSVGGSRSKAPVTGPHLLLRQKVSDLALENHVAVSTISSLRKKVAELEATIELQSNRIVELEKPKGRPQPPARSHSAPKMEIAPSYATTNAKRRIDVAPAKEPTKLPLPQHHFDAMTSVQQLRSNPREPPQEPHEDTPPRNYNEMMINRLRRAIAPPPTKEQMGEVVHAMVTELCRQLQKRGSRLPLKKLEPCVYHCGKRKMHLTVDSGRLVIKSGGGHVDLLEHIERNKLCVQLV